MTTPGLAVRTRRRRTVLQIEDADFDYEAVRRAVARVRPDLQLTRCLDVSEGVRMLADLVDSDLPALILLDLNLPDADGRELLSAIRADPRLSRLAVVVLSTSTNPRDVDESYAAGADGYVVKPVGYKLLESTLQGVLDYWVPAGQEPDA